MTAPIKRLCTRAHFDTAAAHLCEACEHMDFMVTALEEPIPTRLRAPGFEALLKAIVGQQVSIAAAASIWGRLEATIDPMTPENFLRKRGTTLRKCGLSAQKARYGRELAKAIATGALDIDGLPRMADEDAILHLTQVPGIGQWTAEIYLLSCLGRPDVFPAGDLALQATYQQVAGLEDRPTTKEMAEIALRWSPYRAVAARILWTYLHHVRRLEAQAKEQLTA
jgi:DNA-3-methyladenine glycosylase II